jgi:hypothetical protein
LIPLLAESVPLPPNTPIPCLICRAESVPTLTFSGTVQLAQSGRLRVFNGKTHQTMGFIVPAEFRGVESSDGTIKAGAVSTAAPGLLARVTYRADGGRNEVTRVVLLTINQCRELMAAEHISDTRSECPD